MPDITSHAFLAEAIRHVGGKPTVLEALWDGDTRGWYLCLSVYVEKGIWPLQRTEYHALGTVMLGTDLRLFQGQVPPWPEVGFVKTFVEQTHGTYGLTLYLPSEEPDMDCPRWSEREHAIACADCSKLIFPTTSPYLPKDICYSCHLRREQKARIQQQEPYDDGVNLYVHQEGVYHRLGYASHFDSFAIAPYVDPALLPGLGPPTIHVVTLEGKALAEIQARLANALEAQLACYEPAEKNSRRSSFYHFLNISYQGTPYELEVKRHEQHRTISDLFDSWQTTGQALADGASYQIYFKRGFTHRDDSVLRYLKYPTPSPKTVEQIIHHYRGTLTEQEVRGTLTKLESLHCLQLAGPEVRITPTGINIV